MWGRVDKITSGAKWEGPPLSNIADYNKFGIINPRWGGVWGINTPSGRTFLLLTEGNINQRELWEIEIALDEAFARAAREAARELRATNEGKGG